MDNQATFWLPVSGSTVAPEVDLLFYVILYISIFFFLLITIGTIYFALKYRHRGGELQTTSGVAHNTVLELIWTIIPTIILIIIFFWGYKVFLKLSVVPANAMVIKLTGQRWFWTFDYPDGTSTVNELVIPIGKKVNMLMTSRDVIHSFFIPVFRTKFDVIPNRYTQSWFEAKELGEFHIFCAEYCGAKHSEMLATVKVVSENDFQKWLEQKAMASLDSGGSLSKLGETLYTSKACFTCHSKDGSKVIGPSFKGVFGRHEQFADGSTLTVDENYLRESILDPNKKIVTGFQPLMPTYQGLLKEREVDALIEYIKTLK